MKLLIKLFFILMIVFVDFTICTYAALAPELEDLDDNNYGELVVQEHNDRNNLGSSSDDIKAHQVVQRFLSQKNKQKNRRTNCKKFPGICGAKGSPGPNCCKRKCVDLVRDSQNCGKCGKKCKYNQICCNGKCVNPSFNKNHCGACNNSCNNGGLCAFGLCNYA
ncbi:stigma-specific STIG1-like protein 3 [Humulus lupulus]|uniref:stigma-specific STIG1-like protein 3 n=1 Tax=Humulus lupulus TaxID=3486 RepID=UPI002B4042FE|nr:stigma-specific STIG1-like protein 3 [Humulus lupulus]